jgi:hypothetical protein
VTVRLVLLEIFVAVLKGVNEGSDTEEYHTCFILFGAEHSLIMSVLLSESESHQR